MIVVNRLASLWFVCGAAFALAACSGGSSSLSAPAVASIDLSPGSIALVAGDSGQLTVTATYTTGAKAGIASGETFTSSDPAVATVSASGAITALAAGTASITATDPGSGKVSAAITVTVSAAQPASISVTPGTTSLLPGATQALSVTAQFAASSTPLTSGLAFTSSNVNIATVSAAGLVTAIAPGSATITVTDAAANQTTSAAITVLIPVTLESIAVTPATASLSGGATETLSVTASYSDGSSQTLSSGLTFASSNSAVATVTAAGLVTAVGPGSATITATDAAANKTASATVAVPVPVTLTSISVTPATASLTVGNQEALSVTANYSNGSSQPVSSGLTFASSNNAVATVTAAGVVKAVAAGSATITVTDAAANKVATASVSVPVPVTMTSISLTLAIASLPIGASETASVTANYSNGTHVLLGTGVSFTSSNPAFATVTGAGVVTAVAAGTVTLTATDTANGLTASAQLTVPPAGSVTLTSIAVTPATATLAAGATQPLTVTGTYSNGTNTVLTTGDGFVSSNSAVATVSAGGIVTAVASGTATITVTNTATGLTASATITVPAATLTSIAVTPATATLAPSATQPLTVTGTYSNGTSAVITTGDTFVSSNPAAATVSSVGLVTAVANGTTTITVRNTATGLTASAGITVAASTTVVGGNVYSNGALDTGVVFHLFGGALNVPAPAPDPSTPFTDGTAGLKVVITGTTGAYSGGAWVASAPRDLRAANAVRFWAKASAPKSSLKIQIGNDAAAGANVNFQVESIGIVLTTEWQQYVLPLPDPAKAQGLDGLFSFADGPNDYTLWFANIQYVNLPSNVLGALATTNPVAVTWPAPSIPIGTTATIPFAPNVVNWTGTVPPLPNGGVLDNVTFRWFTLTSSDPTVATVSPDGVVSGVSIGTANITATMAGVAVPGEAAVRVTAVPTTPTTYAPRPTLPASSVTALFDSSGVYPRHAVDSFGRLFCPGSTVTNPFAISGGTGVIDYNLNTCVGVTFGDGESGNTTNTVNASGYTTFHVDVWSPNPDNLQIQLVNDAAAGSPSKAVGIYNAGVIAASQWVSLDIPFTSFTALNAENALQQLVFAASTNSMILYVDNIYFH